MKKIFVIAIILLMAVLVFAADGQTVLNFMKIGLGGRASAMGEAYSGLAEDVSATYWNPAALAYNAQTRKQELSFYYNKWLADMTHSSVMYYKKLPFWDGGVYGFNINHLGMADWDDTDGEEPAVEAGETTFGFSIANRLKHWGKDESLYRNLFVGGNVKYGRQNLDGDVHSAFAFDLSLFYEHDSHLKAGLMLQNIFGGKVEYTTTEWLEIVDEDDTDSTTTYEERTFVSEFTFPQQARLGISYKMDVNDWLRWTNSLDMRLWDADNDMAYYFGTEARMWSIFTVRGGYKLLPENDLASGLTGGFGVEVSKFLPFVVVIDYAYNSTNEVFDANHRLSLTFRAAGPGPFPVLTPTVK